MRENFGNAAHNVNPEAELRLEDLGEGIYLQAKFQRAMEPEALENFILKAPEEKIEKVRDIISQLASKDIFTYYQEAREKIEMAEDYQEAMLKINRGSIDFGHKMAGFYKNPKAKLKMSEEYSLSDKNLKIHEKVLDACSKVAELQEEMNRFFPQWAKLTEELADTILTYGCFDTKTGEQTDPEHNRRLEGMSKSGRKTLERNATRGKLDNQDIIDNLDRMFGRLVAKK